MIGLTSNDSSGSPMSDTSSILRPLRIRIILVNQGRVMSYVIGGGIVVGGSGIVVGGSGIVVGGGGVMSNATEVGM